MAKQQFTNNASALITSNITPASLSFTIESAFADRFPVLVGGDWFIGTLQSSAGDIEVIRVNKRDVGSNAVQNVVRAQEGTTALSLSAGEAIFSVRATAAHHQATSDHMIDADDAHPSSAISFAPTVDIESTNAQAAIEEAYTKLTAAIALASGLLGSSKVSITDLVAQTHTFYTTAGTAPDFTITPVPAITAYTRQRFQIKAHAAGSTDTSTLNVSGLGAKAIKRYGPSGSKLPVRFAENQYLDIFYDGADMVVLNAPSVSEAPGDVAFSYTPTQAPGTSRILVQGQCIQIALYPSLAFLWCGSTYNNNVDPNLKADFFYKCADPMNPSATRSDLGGWLKLPDAGYFLRSMNTAPTGVDGGRNPYKNQLDDNKDHTHTSAGTRTGMDAANPGAAFFSSSGDFADFGPKDIAHSGGTEARPKNRPVYEWICY